MSKFELINADCLGVLESWEGEGLDLIYIDPPFNSGRDYCFYKNYENAGELAFTDAFENFSASASLDSLRRENASVYEFLTSVRKRVGSGLFNYLTYMAPRLIAMRNTLKHTGSVYLHCDDSAGFYLKILMDCIYGINNFRNCIIWERSNGMNSCSRRFLRNADYILFYTKSSAYTFNMQYKSLKESTLRGYSKKDEYGRVYKTHDVYSHSGGAPNSRILTWIIDGVVYKAPRGVSFIWTQETLDRRRAEHRAKYGTELVEINKKGAPMVKVYLEEKKGAPLRTVWTDIYPLASNSNERVGYPTQKPEALLERIILASSNPGDLVADFFMGSGTTGVAALKLGRRFVGCDVNPEAVRLARERLGGG